MFEVVTLLAAEIEIQTAFAAIADTSLVRAEKLEANIRAALLQLASFPHSGPPYFGRIYRLVLNPGPHAIFYSVVGQRVFIHAFLDTRQHPSVIQRRLGI